MAGLYPIALSMMMSQNLGEVDAWAKAILRERQLCGKHACSSATKIIVRALAWSFSTSDVERLLHGSGSFVFGLGFPGGDLSFYFGTILGVKKVTKPGALLNLNKHW
jgi:hypothetical protein